MHETHAHHDHKDRNFTVEVAEPSQCKRVLTIRIAREEIEREEAVVYKKMHSDMKIPGFRKGKIPEKYIWKNYGDIIHSDAVQNLLPQIYEMALIKEGINAIGNPSFTNIEGKRGDDITLEVAVEIRPDIRIENYQNIKVVAAKKEIGDAEVDAALEQLKQRMATIKAVERPSIATDIITIDYAPILEDGSIDQRHLSKNYTIDLASQNVLREFIDALTGVQVSDEKLIDVHYPEEFPEKALAGTQKKFHVTVREIKEKSLPELTDEFVKQLGAEITTLADLRQQVKTDLVEDDLKRFNREIEEKVIDVILEQEPFEVPETMVENYLHSVIDEDRKRRPHISNEEEREKEIRELFKEAAVRTVKKYFIIEAIKKQENIAISDEELKERIDGIAGGGESGDPIRQYFEHPDHRERLIGELKDERVLAFLRDSATVTAA